jgi:hypothetical protein
LLFHVQGSRFGFTVTVGGTVYDEQDQRGRYYKTPTKNVIYPTLLCTTYDSHKDRAYSLFHATVLDTQLLLSVIPKTYALFLDLLSRSTLRSQFS